MKVGFVGLGLMGRPMSQNLRKAGHELFLFNRSGVPESHRGEGMTACDTPADVARQADAIITMVSDTPDVEAVLFGPGGVAEGLSAGKLVIDMSSISPVATKAFAEKIGALGCGYVDAPVSGGDIGAQAGTLTIMSGGSEADFERAKPLFEAMGKTITLVGEVGAGQTCKVANQIIVALNIQAVAEALTFASKAGADPVRVRQALLGGFASSRVLEVHAERMIKRTFKPGFKLALHSKDLEIALSSARAIGVSLPNTSTCQQLFNSCMAAGQGDEDDSIVCMAIEKLAGHEIA